MVAALVIVGGLWLVQRIPGVIPEKRSEEILKDWFAQNARAEVTAGYLTPLFYPGLGLQVRDVEVNFAAGGERGGDFFRAKAVKLVVDTGELIHNRRLEVKEVIIVKPRVTLIMEENGKFNVARWMKNTPIAKKARENKGKKKPPPEDLIEWQVRELIEDFKIDFDSGLAGLLSIGKLEVEDAEIKLIDRCPDKRLILAPVTLSRVDLNFKGAFGGDPARFNLKLPFPQGYGGEESPLVLRGRLSAVSDDEIKLHMLSGGWEGIKFNSVTGKVKLGPKPRFDVDVDLTASFPSVHALATWKPTAFSKTIPDMEGNGSTRFRVRLWGPAPTRAAKVHYQGRADVQAERWWPGRVIAPFNNVRFTALLEDGVAKMPETTMLVGGQRISGHGFITESKNPRFTISVKADKLDFKKFFHPRKTPYVTGKPMPRMMTLWGGEAYIGEGFYKKIHIYKVRGKWDMTNQRLVTFPELTLESCGGTYIESGRSWMDFNHPSSYKLNFDGKIRGMDFATFTDQFFNASTFLHGNVDADGRVFFRFENKEFVKRSIEGDLDLKVIDGHFEGFNVAGKLLEMFKLKVPDQYKGMKFKHMKGHVRFERGVAYTEDLEVETPQLTGHAKGWIDFDTKFCDMKIKIRFLTPITDFMRGVPLAGVALGPAGDAVSSVYVRVHGHWDELNYTVYNPADDGPPAPPALGPE